MAKKQTANCNIEIDTWDFSGSELFLPPNEIYVLKIDYPLSCAVEINIKTGKKGLGFAGIINKIVKSYKEIYKEEEDWDSLHGDCDYDSPYGIGLHGIGDLAISGICVDHKKKNINLYISS